MKSNLGIGQFNKGKINNEDWIPEDGLSYINNLSGQSNGRFAYYTADVGYDFLRSSDYKVGGLWAGPITARVRTRPDACRWLTRCIRV
ncbi:hypothetical protein [Bradyrhizobium sp. B117]|uniref:hypothetical protein n=1 Tax=Bradyrhizobium sp. B117 TaxID=3140246 RepID=UPI003183CDFA